MIPAVLSPLPSTLRRVARLGLVALPLMLGGCDLIVLNPFGDIAQRQADLMIQSTVLMLLIIVPVMILTAVFAWRYRAGNPHARYDPEWSHSTQLELVIWGCPLLIIICLGAITWMGTHLLDPFRPTERIDASRPGLADQVPLEIDVVALDWKWLFFYPEQGVASLNELALPIDRPVSFHITSATVMNSFYIPALAGQIYAMPGMESRLHAVLNHTGRYEGFSANYSGAGFSKMRFVVQGVDDAGFTKWVQVVRSGGTKLDTAGYLKLEAPSEGDKIRHFGAVEDGLFHRILNLCVQPGKICLDEMMAIDMHGGAGRGGHKAAELEYDKYTRRGGLTDKDILETLCTLPADSTPQRAAERSPLPFTPVRGLSLPRPSNRPPSPLAQEADAALRSKS